MLRPLCATCDKADCELSEESSGTRKLFGRDEIWFVAKGKGQNSGLYSLVEFKNDKGESVRKDAKYDKQYLEGKYGADPYHVKRETKACNTVCKTNYKRWTRYFR